jgi:hypothetical protein
MHLSLVCVISLLTASANAQTAGDALKEFGLVGTWSEDCGKDPAKTPVRRLVYTVPTFGRPKVTLGGSIGVNEMEIQTVSRFTEDKLKYVFVYKKMMLVSSPPAEPQEIVLQKLRYRIRILSWRSTDGKTPTVENGKSRDSGSEFIFEKCLD